MLEVMQGCQDFVDTVRHGGLGALFPGHALRKLVYLPHTRARKSQAQAHLETEKMEWTKKKSHHWQADRHFCTD